MRTNEEMINLIVELRKQKSMTASDLAAAVGIAKSAMSRYENKSRQFPVNKVGDFARVLNTTPEFLLGLGEETKSDILTIYNKLSSERKNKVYYYAEEQLNEQESNIVPMQKTKPADDVETLAAHKVDPNTEYTKEEIDKIKKHLEEEKEKYFKKKW